MTTKNALSLAIAALQKEKPSAKITEAIEQLQQLQKRDLITRWNKEKIIASLDDWKKQNNRIPTVTNLTEPGMPGASIIQKHFDMSASALLHKLYPIDNEASRYKGRYGFISNDDWLNCFREQFLKHRNEKYFSSKTYNKFRDKGTPAWNTIAEHCGVIGWLDLMRLADVEYAHRTLTLEPGKLHIVNERSPLLERYIAAVEKEEELCRNLIRTLEKHPVY